MLQLPDLKAVFPFMGRLARRRDSRYPDFPIMFSNAVSSLFDGGCLLSIFFERVQELLVLVIGPLVRLGHC